MAGAQPWGRTGNADGGGRGRPYRLTSGASLPPLLILWRRWGTAGDGLLGTRAQGRRVVGDDDGEDAGRTRWPKPCTAAALAAGHVSGGRGRLYGDGHMQGDGGKTAMRTCAAAANNI